jgi:PTH1 family peptidyl-tRNA hydrolase
MDDNQRKFVVGLGNPGSKYRRTRHNVGWMVLAELAKRWQASPPRKAFSAEVCEASVASRRVMLLAPQTYMNLSGQAVQEMAAFYKAAAVDLLIVLDDMALPLGQLRFRPGGSSGGHKGLADIVARLGAQEVPRLRIGIGSPPPWVEGADFVLSTFGPDEEPVILQAVVLAATAVEDWLTKGMTCVMEKYNRKGGEPSAED